MRKFKRNIISVISLIAIILTLGNGSIYASETGAEVNYAEESVAIYDEGRDGLNDEAKRTRDTWVLQSTKNVTVQTGTLTLYSYVMTLTNDTKLAKAETTHLNSSDGYYAYSRARFETIFGQVNTASDTGRKFGTYSSHAETPTSSSGGWGGLAKTYCGDRYTSGT